MDRKWFYSFFEQDYFRKTPEQIDTSIDEAIPQVEFLIDTLGLNPTDRILGVFAYPFICISLRDMGIKKGKTPLIYCIQNNQ